ncbi:MAG: hypothetical protein ACOCV1_07660 [Bacillota bacterium]
MILFKKPEPKNIFLGKNKAIKYLKKTDQKTTQNDLLKLYTDGTLEEILSKYSFDLIEVYVDGNYKLGLDLQINIRKGNKNIGIDFLSDNYETCFYLAGCTPEDVENSIVKYDYKDFDLDVLLKELESKFG